MDFLKNIIGYLSRITIVVLFAALVWWLVGLLFPMLSFSQVKQLIAFSSVNENGERKPLLPSPRLYKAWLERDAQYPPKEYQNVAPPSWDDTIARNANIPWNSSYQSVSNVNTMVAQPNKPDYLRNLSLYSGSVVYTNMMVYGEAHTTMFVNGKFPIIVSDKQGRMLGVVTASSTASWVTSSSWSRFEARINIVLPTNTPCSLTFQQARSVPNPVSVAVPVMCR
ncbi:MAG: hypothetical protein RI935_111 [Candidatus Parcubacteria bacterium]|jgi:hypothetical protein